MKDDFITGIKKACTRGKLKLCLLEMILRELYNSLIDNESRLSLMWMNILHMQFLNMLRYYYQKKKKKKFTCVMDDHPNQDQVLHTTNENVLEKETS